MDKVKVSAALLKGLSTSFPEPSSLVLFLGHSLACVDI